MVEAVTKCTTLRRTRDTRRPPGAAAAFALALASTLPAWIIAAAFSPAAQVVEEDDDDVVDDEDVKEEVVEDAVDDAVENTIDDELPEIVGAKIPSSTSLPWSRVLRPPQQQQQITRQRQARRAKKAARRAAEMPQAAPEVSVPKMFWRRLETVFTESTLVPTHEHKYGKRMGLAKRDMCKLKNLRNKENISYQSPERP